MHTKTLLDNLKKTLMVLGIILALFSFINATTNRNSNQIGGNGQQQQNRRHSMGEQRTEEGSGGKDFFREYLSRGMFSCATKYVGILQKLNKLIVTAHQEYSECKGQMRQAEQNVHQSRKLAAQLEMINELLNED